MARVIEPEGDAGTRIEVCLTENKNVQVRVFSCKRPGLISSGFVDPMSEKVHAKVMLMAGAIAEYQCDKYGDGHDPDSVAHAAGKAFEQLMRKVKDGLQGQKRQG